MITLTEEQVELLCDKYCRFPFMVDAEDMESMESICDQCPLSEGEKYDSNDQ